MEVPVQERERLDDILSKLSEEDRKELQESAKKMAAERLSFLGELFKKAESGDMAALAEALDRGDVKASTVDEQGRTLLHMAAFGGRKDVAAFLLNEKGANVNARDEHGRTPLHCAAFGNHVSVAKFLVLKGADVNALDSSGSSPLHWASKKGNEELIELLVARESNLNAQTKEGWTPLHLLCEGGHTTAAKLLVSRGANINILDQGGASPLRVAVNAGNAELVVFFLERNAEGVNTKLKDTALIDLACVRKSFDVVDLLIKYGADVTERMVKIALKDSNMRLLRICVEKNTKGIPQTGLYLACKKGEFDLVSRMVEELHFKVDMTCFKLAHESGDGKLKEWVRIKAAAELGQKCLSCGREESDDLKLKRCGRCHIVKFCGAACQKKANEEHKIHCFA